MQAIYILSSFKIMGNISSQLVLRESQVTPRLGFWWQRVKGWWAVAPQNVETVLEMWVYSSWSLHSHECAYSHGSSARRWLWRTAGHHTTGRVLVLFLPVLVDSRQSPNPSTLVPPNAELTVFVQPGSRTCHKSQRRHGCSSYWERGLVDTTIIILLHYYIIEYYCIIEYIWDSGCFI